MAECPCCLNMCFKHSVQQPAAAAAAAAVHIQLGLYEASLLVVASVDVACGLTWNMYTNL